jgi:hypothetical protein
MAFDKYCSGLCPECLLADTSQELWLDRGDIFECPRCHLMVSLASPLRATIPRRRGRENFRSLTDKYYCAAGRVRDLVLAREIRIVIINPPQAQFLRSSGVDLEGMFQAQIERVYICRLVEVLG